MLQDLYRLPRWFLATVFIGAGIAFIVLNDRPHEFCDAQINNFQSKQQVNFTKLIKVCRETNSPGGCYKLFSQLDQLLKNFYLVSPRCFDRLSQASLTKKPRFKMANLTKPEKKELGEKSSVKQVLFQGMELMVFLAWREEALSGKVGKFNWLGPADMILFCAIKEAITSFYGRDSLRAFENQLLQRISSKQKTAPQIIKRHSILSENCALYSS